MTRHREKLVQNPAWEFCGPGRLPGSQFLVAGIRIPDSGFPGGPTPSRSSNLQGIPDSGFPVGPTPESPPTGHGQLSV